MSLFKFLKSIVSNEKDAPTAPEGYCPNCWGRQEYSGHFYNAVKVEGIDTNNIDEKKGWVQAYAEKYLTGIALKKDDAQLVCNRCSMKYEISQ